jgi:hypothetical protein
MALSPSTESVTHIFGVPSAGTPFRSNGEQRLRRVSRDEEKGGYAEIYTVEGRANWRALSCS